MAEYEQEIAPLKRRLFAQLLGGLGASEAAPAQLLEVGVGTGPNLPFYAEFYATAGHPAGDAAAAAGSREAAAAATAPPPSAAQALPPLHITGLDPNPYMREYLQQVRQHVVLPEASHTCNKQTMGEHTPQTNRLPARLPACPPALCISSLSPTHSHAHAPPPPPTELEGLWLAGAAVQLGARAGRGAAAAGR